MKIYTIALLVFISSVCHGVETTESKINRAKNFVKSFICNKSSVKFKAKDTIVDRNIVTLTFLFKDSLEKKHQEKTVSIYLYN